MNTPITAEEVEYGLARLHNGSAEGFQGFSSEFLRYAKQEPKHVEAPPVHVLCQPSQQPSMLPFRVSKCPRRTMAA